MQNILSSSKIIPRSQYLGVLNVDVYYLRFCNEIIFLINQESTIG